MRSISLESGRLYRQPGSPYWSLDLALPGQPRLRKSLRTRDRAIALRIATQIVRRAMEERWGISLITDGAIETLLPEYEKHARLRNVPRTVDHNLKILRGFLEYIKEARVGSPPILLSAISPERVETYLGIEKAKGLSATTLNRKLGALSTFFNFARRSRMVQTNPLEHVQKLPVVRNRIPSTLGREEIRRLLKGAQMGVACLGRGRKGKGNTRVRKTPIADMIIFALNTGARLGEMLYLEWPDIDFQQGILRFRNKPEHALKDREDRRVPGNAAVIRMLRRRLLQSGSLIRWVFPNAIGGILRRENALRELKRIADRAKVPWANFQLMRRTFLTSCASAGIPSFVLKALAGHSSVKTTEQYYIGVIGALEWKPPVVGA